VLRTLAPPDYLTLFLFLAAMPTAGIVIALRKRSAETYFLAGRSLKWWAVAGSIFGTNINSSHLIGMLGIGYSVGFAQSHYEVLAVPAILVLAYVFLPAYRQQRVFTLSQFLEPRYSASARLVYTILVLGLIGVQLVGGLYIGSRTLVLLFQGTNFELAYWQGVTLIALITCSYTMNVDWTAGELLRAVGGFLLLQVPLILAFRAEWVPPGLAAALGAVLAFVPFGYRLRRTKAGNWLRDDRFWAGILSGCTVAILYFFT
jgi:Na+/pantothenate symporter